MHSRTYPDFWRINAPTLNYLDALAFKIQTTMQPILLNPDFSAIQYQENLYLHYQQYLETSPVFQNDESVVYLTRYEDCVALLSGKQFKRHPLNGHSPFSANRSNITTIEEMISHWMLFSDPPRHKVIREAFAIAFSAQAINKIEPFIQKSAQTLINEIPQSGEVEMLKRFAYPFPVIVIAEILGVPVSDMALFYDWSVQLTHALDSANEAGFRQGSEVTLALSDYFKHLFWQRSALPPNCLINTIQDMPHTQLSSDEILYGFIFLLWSGHETTKNLIANGIQLLAERPEVRDQLIQQPSLITQTIEEMLRFDTPVQKISRWTHEPAIFGEFNVPAGTLITALLGAANRDPLIFQQPSQFDIHRHKNRHIAFGSGIHHCLGALLARLEAKIAFETLLPKMSHCSPGQHRWRTYSAFRSMDLLTINL
jgi:cytochrome P450